MVADCDMVDYLGVCFCVPPSALDHERILHSCPMCSSTSYVCGRIDKHDDLFWNLVRSSAFLGSPVSCVIAATLPYSSAA